MGLLIASLCLKHNNIEENLAKENVVSYNNVSPDTTKERIKTLKELKESGLIDEETYQEKLKNIINDL